jgi:adenosine deaminase
MIPKFHLGPLPTAQSRDLRRGCVRQKMIPKFHLGPLRPARYNTGMATPTREFLERMPKVDLHIHLEGAVPQPALDELTRKYGVSSSAIVGAAEDGGKGSPGQARGPFRPSFADFVEVWIKIGGLLREYEDYTFIARALGAELKRQNILYAEILFSPARDATAHLRPERITEAVAQGLKRTPCLLVVDFVRDNGPREAGRTLEALLAKNERRIAGIGIGGSEAPFPPEPFAAIFEKARAAGLRTQAHAGESAGPKSIWGTIRSLRPDRIAHGIRAREDAALMAYLKNSGLPLDVCPTSNVRTGAVESMADHPAADFLRRGLKISLGTDDPTLFGTDLASEYEALVTTFGLTAGEVRTLLLNGIDAAWCGPAEKSRLRKAITDFFGAPAGPG